MFFETTLAGAVDFADVLLADFGGATQWPSNWDMEIAPTLLEVAYSSAGAAHEAEVEPKVAHVLEAIADPTFLSIPGPDELMAAALGGLTPDNRGAKEAFGSWAIVVRPQDGATGAKAFAWWAWNGARLLDSDADLHGWAATQGEALALAKQAIAGQPADYEAQEKE